MDHCLMIGQSAFAVETSEMEAIDIDTETDLKIAEVIMKEGAEG